MSSNRVFREAAETSGKAHCNADVKQAGAYDPLIEGFSGLPGPNPAEFFKQSRKKSRKKGADVHKHPKMSKTLQEQELERQRIEGGEDAKYGAATYTLIDTLATDIAKFGDVCRETTLIIEQLLNERLDHGTSADTEEAIKDVKRLSEEVEKFGENIKAFRQW